MGLAIRMAIVVTPPVLTGVLVWWGVMLTAPALLIRRWRRRHRGAPRRRLWPSAARARRAEASPASQAGLPSGVAMPAGFAGDLGSLVRDARAPGRVAEELRPCGRTPPPRHRADPGAGASLFDETLEPLCRYVDFRRRLELAVGELERRLSGLPADRWRIEQGIIFLEIDGLAGPVLRRAMRDGNTPVLARWLADGSHGLIEWEPDLSSQTGASQAGILLGSNEDIPAFRWVEKETGRLMTCSAPDDCAEIERRHASGVGLLIDGGASRGNLLSGEADEVILTVSRMEADKKANPGYRAFLANGFNVTRELVLFCWEVGLEWSAAARQRRRDVIPRGHRGGRYPFLRAALCVVVRDLIAFGVVTDMMRGRPGRVRDLLELRRGRPPLGA